VTEDIPPKRCAATDAKKLIPPLYGARAQERADVQLFEQLLFAPPECPLDSFFCWRRAASRSPSRTPDPAEALKAAWGAECRTLYYLARTCLMKDERYYDRYDNGVCRHFKGAEDLFASAQRDYRMEIGSPRWRCASSPTPKKGRDRRARGWEN